MIHDLQWGETTELKGKQSASGPKKRYEIVEATGASIEITNEFKEFLVMNVTVTKKFTDVFLIITYSFNTPVYTATFAEWELYRDSEMLSTGTFFDKQLNRDKCNSIPMIKERFTQPGNYSYKIKARQIYPSPISISSASFDLTAIIIPKQKSL